MNSENNKTENGNEIDSAETIENPSIVAEESNSENPPKMNPDVTENIQSEETIKNTPEEQDISEEVQPESTDIPEDNTDEPLLESETVTDQPKKTKTSKKEKCNPFISFLYETLEMVAISIGIVILLITFVVRYSPVSGESMTYTINEDDSLLVQIAFYTPEKNDIVILQSPDYDLNKPLIKRVIATGGDTLEINFDTWEVKVNGTLLDEAYVRHNPFEYNPGGDDIPEDTPMSHQDIYNIPEGSFDAETNTFKATVPEGTIFVMGDNRNNSHDSRSSNVGFVDERCVIGKAVYRLYPFSNAGKLD